MALFNYECDEVKRKIDEVSPNYPQLTTFEKEWLYFYEHGYIPGIPVGLEYETVLVNPTGYVSNAIPFQYKSAILKGNTKYRDIDTGDILDTFDETKNLELVSVKMPVLTTTNGEPEFIEVDGEQVPNEAFKSNILTVNEEVELRGIDEGSKRVEDELNLLTGELTERIGEIVLDGSEGWGKFGDETETTWRTSFRLQEAKSASVCICDKFVYSKGATEEKVKIYITGTPNLSLTVRKSDFPNIEVLKSWLSINKPVVYYELAEPTIKTVDLTPLNKPYEDINHYELTSNIPCEAILKVPVVSTGKQTLEEINN